MLGCDNSFVVNTKTGQLLETAPLELDYVCNVARAVLAFKYAGVVAQKLPRRIKTTPLSQIYISVDLEYLGEVIYEVGAVAYVANTDRVVGVFHRLWSATSTSTSTTNGSHSDDGDDGDADGGKPRGMAPGAFEALTGLRQVNTVTPNDNKDQFKIRQEFSDWVDSVTVTPTYVYWGSNDNDLVLLGVNGCPRKINAMATFRAWLDNIKQSRKSNYTLTDAVNQCFGILCFESHRAYEDSTMTAAVLTAITDIDSRV
jgi:hypothetical protein